MNVSGQRFIVHSSRSDVFTIWNFSDVHYGNKACAVENFKRDIQKVKDDPYSFWLSTGDLCDYISYTDKRFDPDVVPEYIAVKDLARLGKKLITDMRDMLVPIKNKCLGIGLGNHELKYMRYNEQVDLHSWLCTELECPNLGYSSMFDVLFLKYAKWRKKPALVSYAKKPSWKTIDHYFKYRFYTHHGAGFATTPGGKLNRLIRFMEYFDADIFFCSHVHDQKGQRLVVIGADEQCKKLIQKEKIGIISGSYLKTYAEDVISYGEQRGYYPTTLGASFVRINPDKNKVTAEV